MSTNQAQLQQIADYINNALANYQPAADLLPLSPDNCAQALHDGVLLSYMMNIMSTSGPVIKQSDLKKTKTTLFHKMDQVNRALQASKKAGLNIVNVRAQSIVEKKQNAIIGLFNQITKQKPGTKVEKPKPKQTKPSAQSQINLTKQNSMKIEQKHEQIKIAQKHEQQTPKIQETKHQQPYSDPKIQQPIIRPPVIEQAHEQQKVGAKITQIYHQSNGQHQPQHDYHQLPPPIKINQSQVILKEAQKGYKFDEVLGPQIVVLCGSLRKGSVNKAIVTCLQTIKKQKYFQNILFHIPDLGILPLMNQDLQFEGSNLFIYVEIPKAVYDLQQIVRKSSGILIATPQYNGSFSAIIKNAFDWLSKPITNKEAGSPLQNKKIGIVSTSFLTQNQIKDTIEMGENYKCNYYTDNFYIPLSSGAFKMQQGKLVKQEELDRLAYWYQQFSYFILSGKPNPEPSPRFIFA